MVENVDGHKFLTCDEPFATTRRIDMQRTMIRAITGLLACLSFGCGGEVDFPHQSEGSETTEAPAAHMDTVAVFGRWELRVTNANEYENPFDFREIELRASFVSPEGMTHSVFGFHDGDGAGGSSGDVWRVRFRPDAPGRWTYEYRWTDGTAGGDGSFVAVDSGLAAPLEIDPASPRFFRTTRGEPFHFRGYDLHVMAPYLPEGSLVADGDSVVTILSSLARRDYNFVMLDGAIGRTRSYRNLWEESWWAESGDPNRFDPGTWKQFERILEAAHERDIYVIPFAGMVRQGEQYAYEDFELFLRYWIARLSSFANFFGYSPTWEWPDIWSPEEVNRMMSYLNDHIAYPTLLSVHDCADSRFQGWLSFSMRQAHSRTLFDGNGRHAGQRQGSCDGRGGVADVFESAPIIGVEDIWESREGKLGFPRNAREVRRAAWGEMLAGVMPLYSEWHPLPPPTGGHGTGEPQIRRMFDFFYRETRYREYRPMNDRVSAAERQAAAGVPGEEFLVYDEDGGPIRLDLRDVPPDRAFTVLWYDPATGDERTAGSVIGGSVRVFQSPIDGDSVLFLERR